MTKQELLVIKEKCIKNLEMATKNNNVARMASFKDQLDRVNAALEELEESNKIEALEIFLDNYKVKAIEYYNNCLEGYNKDLKEVKPTLQNKTVGSHKITASKQWNDFINKKYGSTTIDIITNRMNNLNEIIEKDVNSKRKAFINRVEKEVGQMTDCRSLKIGINNEINGVVIGTKGSVKVETITAGGYNIQKLHYRVLIKR